MRTEDSGMPLHGPALVTGSSGFFGGHLVARLAREGVAVTAMDAAEPRQTLPTSVRDLRVDVRAAAAVREAVLATRPDVVYHLAAQASVSVSMRDPVADIQTNVLGTVHLAQAAIDAGVRRFVFVSTGGALYGEPAVVPVTEELRATPASVYGASKLAAEQYLSVLLTSSAMTLSVLRPGNIYGPAQDPHGEAGVVAIFTQRMLRGEPVTIFGDGSQQRDYVYVDDVVDAALLAATGSPATCLIGSGAGTSTLTIWETLARLTASGGAPQYAAERPGDIQRTWLDSSHARAVWGWTPRVSLEDGMARTVEWFRAQVRP
jgi:UDP-glucose 4-epimerase